MTVRSSFNRKRAQSKEFPVENSARDRIVAGARRHFFAYGLRGVTMDDLAKELGMSKKTLYAHFPSKMALLKAVLLNKLHNIEADLEEITSVCASDFPTALRQLLACIQKHSDEAQPPFVRDIEGEAWEQIKSIQAQGRQMIYRQFGKFLDEGQKAGIIRQDIPTKLVIEILLGARDAIMNPEKLSELEIMPKIAVAAIITVILEGVITETGRTSL